MFSQIKRLFICCFLLVSGIGFSQYLRIPYYEPFENPFFSDSWQIQQKENGRVTLEKIDESHSNSLNISVKGNDHPSMAVKTDGRTRTEIALLNHPIENNDEYFYSWDLLIPENQDFTKQPASADDNYYVIMQWHEAGEGIPTYCLNGNDIRKVRAFPVSLRLVPDSLGQDSKMNLHLKYGTTYGPGNSSNDGDICLQDPHSRGYREYIIKKAIKIGEWNHIVTQIKWSIDGDSAYILMWINDLPIINDNSIEQYRRKGRNPDLYQGNENTQASKLGGVPLLYTRVENGIEIVEQNYQKLGHYRKNYYSDNIILIDNYRITNEYPPKPYTTSLTDIFCNKEIIAQENYLLETYEISPADNYLFRFEDDLTQISNEVTSYNHFLDLMEKNWIQAGKTYDVNVRALNDLNNRRGFEFGKSCKITTPAETRLFDIYSGKNLSSPYIVKKNENIYSYPLPGATDYLFRVTDVQDSTKIIWIPGNGKNINSLNLSKVSGIKENATYQISVKAARMEKGKDVYSHLNTGELDFIMVKKPGRNLDKKVKIKPSSSTDFFHIQSKTKLKNIYLISKTGEILLKSSVNGKEAIFDIFPFKNELSQIVVVDKRGYIFIMFSHK